MKGRSLEQIHIALVWLSCICVSTRTGIYGLELANTKRRAYFYIRRGTTYHTVSSHTVKAVSYLYSIYHVDMRTMWLFAFITPQKDSSFDFVNSGDYKARRAWAGSYEAPCWNYVDLWLKYYAHPMLEAVLIKARPSCVRTSIWSSSAHNKSVQIVSIEIFL